jgi:hypothetical protein
VSVAQPVLPLKVLIGSHTPLSLLPNNLKFLGDLLGSNDRGVWEPIKTFNGKTGWATDTWRSFSLVEQDES